MFNKKILAAIICGLTLTGVAQAAVINSANIGGLTTFQDTNTGRVWLDMNNFYNATATAGTTGFNMIAAATANGFTIAKSNDVNQLFSGLSLTGGAWSSYATVMGASNPRNLIWGMYDDGNGDSSFPWAWAFSGASSWSFGGSTDANTVQNNNSSGAMDMGIWAYRTTTVSAVPEAETYAMLLAGLGLIGFSTRRKNKHAA